MGESLKSSESIGSSLVGNGLTSDVLRASVIEYYNSCHQHGSRPDVLCNSVHKSNSVTQLNGLVNGTKSLLKSEQNLCYRGHTTPSSRPPPPRSRTDRPHRTHSERGNKIHAVRNLNRAIESHAVTSPNKGLYRSNSSLDLEHSGEMLDERTGILRRDYGSASSLDVISTTGESFFAMLREFRSENFDQRSPGPAKIHEYLKGKIDPPPSTQNAANTLTNGPDSLEESHSPKIKTKFQKLWEIKDKGKVKAKVLVNEPSIFKKFRGSKADVGDTGSKGSDNSLDVEIRIEEKLRKKAFAHYDCQSVLANLSYASRLRSLLSKRRNTTTGASAASMLNRTPANSTENLNPEDSDSGDGRSNELLMSCPFFRNELGGEEERMISLSRITCKKQKAAESPFGVPVILHRPSMAYGLSILEKNSNSRWMHRLCPYLPQCLPMERVDNGAMCYRHFFYGQEHQNWFGLDENLGPVAISIKRERIEHLQNQRNCHMNNNIHNHYQYRLIVRTSELSVMRGTVLEEAVPSLTRSNQRHCHAKEVIDYVAPELQLSSLRLAIQGPQMEDQLLKLDEQALTKTYKVGIMYCKAGQSTEEEMYNNEHPGPAFEEFLDLLGQRVRLKSFEKYRGGLDTKTDTTGLFSVFTTHQNCEIMFHVSTLLPYTPNNKQQLLRKRHIGNDIVTIVFQEPDALPFTPKNIRSHFQHVFIVVRVMNPCSDSTHYKVAVSRSKEVPVFGPPIPETATFPKSDAFVDFLLSKVINAENAAHHSDKFVMMAQRTRQEYLKDLVANYCTNTTIDSGPKFSILSFAGRKKEKTRPRFIPDRFITGAISWQLQVEDFGQSVVVECLLAISADTFVVIEETNQEVIFVCPCASILGWSSQTTSLKVFYHQGECIVLHSKDPDVDEIQEIVSRLMAVTDGCETQELILRRNSLGQLGFHVQFEGCVTEVENFGFAWQAGLRQGSRLVEICKVAIATLSYDQMVDLLKTSMTVSVTVIPPFPNGAARRGCNLHNCAYLSGGSYGDYENINVCEHSESHHSSATPRQQTPFHAQRKTSRREICSSLHHGNRSPSIDRINSKSEGKNFRLESRDRQQQQHHSVLSMRNMPDSLAAVFPSRLSSYNINSSVSTSKQNSPSKSPAVFPTPRVSPVSSGSSHSHSSSPLGSMQSHLHRSFHDHNRSSMNQRLTHVGSMVAARSELSLAEISPFHSRSHSHHLSVCPINSKSSGDGSMSRRAGKSHGLPSNLSSTSASHSSKRSPASMHSDCHSDSSNDWLQGASSADELSCETTLNVAKHNSENAKCNSAVPGRKMGDPSSKLSRLRPGVTSCHSRPTKNNLPASSLAVSSGSSCSGSTSTLQEDLLKLINPEFLDSDSNSDDHHHHLLDSCSEPGSRTQLSTPSSAHEHSTGNTPDPALDVILTKAQPAHVISSEPSSPAALDNRIDSCVSFSLSISDRLSPRATTDRGKLKPLPPAPPSPSPLIPLPDSQDIDWSSLVSTATKAIESIPVADASWLEAATQQLNLDSSCNKKEQLQDLEAKLMRMQQDLVKEQHQKADLEHEVLQLREENQRLMEQSQSAAAQIRRYREWLLQNRDNT